MITNLNYPILLSRPDWGDTLVFVDYDGTIIKSYDNSVIQSLTSIPALPNHSGDDIPLTSQGWNWTLSEIKSYNLLYPNKPITVGPLYCPTDNKTHIVFYASNSVQIVISGTAEVDWGDGTIEILSGGMTHTYSSSAVHEVSIEAISWSSSGYGIEIALKSEVKHVRCGKDLYSISSGNGSDIFGGFIHNLKTMTCSTDIGDIHFYTTIYKVDGNLPVLILPRATRSGHARYIFASLGNCKALASSYAGTTPPSDNVYSLYLGANSIRFTTPDGINRVDGFGVYTDKDVVISGAVTTVLNTNMDGNLILGSNVSEVKNLNFKPTPTNTHSLTLKGTIPPTLWGNTPTLIGNPPQVIYVPYSANHTVLNRYRNDTNWSAYASIIEESPQ